jgi:hypothetical protein
VGEVQWRTVGLSLFIGTEGGGEMGAGGGAVLGAAFSMVGRSRGGARRRRKASGGGVPCFGVGGGRRRPVGLGGLKGRVGRMTARLIGPKARGNSFQK